MRNYISYFNKICRICWVSICIQSLKFWRKFVLPWLKYSIFGRGLFCIGAPCIHVRKMKYYSFTCSLREKTNVFSVKNLRMFAAVNMQSVTASNLPWTGDHFGTRNISLMRFMRMKLKLIKVFEKTHEILICIKKYNLFCKKKAVLSIFISTTMLAF